MSLRAAPSLPPDPVTEYYKKDVDRTLLREHLKLTPQQRLEKLVAFMRSQRWTWTWSTGEIRTTSTAS